MKKHTLEPITPEPLTWNQKVGAALVAVRELCGPLSSLPMDSRLELIQALLVEACVDYRAIPHQMLDGVFVANVVPVDTTR